MRVLFWGTYDLSKPRNRIILAGLRTRGVEVIECRTPVWDTVADKSTLNRTQRMRFWLRLVAAYPGLVRRFLRAPKADVVLVGYLGQFDVLVLWPFARLRRIPVVWDAYLSLYNTLVEDRQLYRRGHPLARAIHLTEWLAVRVVDLVLLDTDAHCAYFRKRFSVDSGRFATVRLGVEEHVFYPAPPRTAADTPPMRPLRVLFYGQLAPLHGIDVILRAAELCRAADIHWQLVGQGQLSPEFQCLLASRDLRNVRWTPWVPYHRLVHLIHQADVCLGVFGTGPKTELVVPNKVLQALAAGRPVITADASAIREQTWPPRALTLIPAGDAAALADTLLRIRSEGRPTDVGTIASACRPALASAAIGAQLVAALQQLRGAHRRPSLAGADTQRGLAAGVSRYIANIDATLRDMARPPLRLAHRLYVRLMIAHARLQPQRGPFLLRRFAGEDPMARARRVAIYAHYDPVGAVHDYHLEALRALRSAGFRITLVSNAERFGPAAAARVAPLVREVLVRRNLGHDFGAWREGLRALGDLGDCRQLVLCNDSVYGPFAPLEAVLAKADPATADVWGMTEGRNHGPHLQSWFLLFHPNAFGHPAFDAFWREMPLISNKFAVIEAGELALSRKLRAAGLRLGALFPYAEALRCFRAQADAERPQQRAMLRALERGRALNPTHHFWRPLIAELGLPFIKRELLALNPAGLDDICAWAVVVAARFGTEPVAARRHLASLAQQSRWAQPAGLMRLLRAIMSTP